MSGAVERTGYLDIFIVGRWRKEGGKIILSIKKVRPRN
jgi:hypothetical protein